MRQRIRRHDWRRSINRAKDDNLRFRALERSLDTAFPLSLPEILPDPGATARLSADIRAEVARSRGRRRFARFIRTSVGVAAAFLLTTLLVSSASLPSDADVLLIYATADAELLRDFADAASRTTLVVEGLLADERRWFEYENGMSSEQDLEALREAFRRLEKVGA